MTGVVVLTAIISVLAVSLYACLSSIKRCKKENAALRGEIKNTAARLEHLRQYSGRNKSLEEAANAEREALNNTDDKNLVHRANGLFGVRDGTGGNGGA